MKSVPASPLPGAGCAARRRHGIGKSPLDRLTTPMASAISGAGTGADDQRRGPRRRSATRAAVAHGPAGSAAVHSCRSSRRRRHRARKTGAPRNAVTMPTCSSDGGDHDPAEDVGEQQHRRAEHDRRRAAPSGGPAPVTRRAMYGHGQAEEPDRAGGGGRRAAQQGDREDAQHADPAGVRAERGGRLVAQAQRVEPAGPATARARSPASRNGATCRTVSTSRSASEPTSQYRYRSNVAGVGDQHRPDEARRARR